MPIKFSCHVNPAVGYLERFVRTLVTLDVSLRNSVNIDSPVQ
jgi:hypothetical protein